MHIGKSYSLFEFAVWTRRRIYALLALSAVPVVLYQVLGLTWLTLPLTVVAALGTATSFIVGFKNAQTYNRTQDAQQVWTSILSTSRYWGNACRDFPASVQSSRDLLNRHFAWLTALRYELRSRRPWETVDSRANTEYQRHYRIPERETPMETELGRYLAQPELAAVLRAGNKASRVLSLQNKALKGLVDAGEIGPSFHMDMVRTIKELGDHQGRAEWIKNSPYPRQYAIINTFFVRTFCALLPFGLLREFDELNKGVSGFMHGHMIWLVIPFSAMISWMYTSLEQVGESTSNPFEGSPNDVPITYISRVIEDECREGLGEALAPLPAPMNHIIL
jgi:putative membrane protein